MTSFRGLGTKQTLTITNGEAYIDIRSASPGIALPSSIPAEPQLSFTPIQANLPVFSKQPVSVSYSVLLTAWGQNVSGSTRVLNGASSRNTLTPAYTGTVTNITNNQYWTIHAGFSVDSNVLDDTFNMFLYSADSSLNLMGVAAAVYPTRIQLESGKILYDVSYEDVQFEGYPFEGVTGLNPSKSSDWYYVYDETTMRYIQSPTTKKVANSDPYSCALYILDLNNGLINKVSGRSILNYYPYHTTARYPHKISYRVLDVECRG